MGENVVKILTGYLAAATLALGVTFAAVGAQAAVICGPHGCNHYYSHRFHPGKYYNTAPSGINTLRRTRAISNRP
jgi:hypothetical protein